MKPHTAVGIATVIFYTPVTLYAQYIGVRCWKYRSRMACYMVMVFTLSTFSVSYLLRISGNVNKVLQYDSPAEP
jgi:hypothetical protein